MPRFRAFRSAVIAIVTLLAAQPGFLRYVPQGNSDAGAKTNALPLTFP